MIKGLLKLTGMVAFLFCFILLAPPSFAQTKPSKGKWSTLQQKRMPKSGANWNKNKAVTKSAPKKRAASKQKTPPPKAKAPPEKKEFSAYKKPADDSFDIFNNLFNHETLYMVGIGEPVDEDIRDVFNQFFILTEADYQGSPWMVTLNNATPENVLQMEEINALKILTGAMELCEAQRQSHIPGMPDLIDKFKNRLKKSSRIFGSGLLSRLQGSSLEDMRFFGACSSECSQSNAADQSTLNNRGERRHRVGDQNCSAASSVPPASSARAESIGVGEGGGGGPQAERTQGGAKPDNACPLANEEIGSILYALFKGSSGSASQTRGSPLRSAFVARLGDGRRAAGSEPGKEEPKPGPAPDPGPSPAPAPAPAPAPSPAPTPAPTPAPAPAPQLTGVSVVCNGNECTKTETYSDGSTKKDRWTRREKTPEEKEAEKDREDKRRRRLLVRANDDCEGSIGCVINSTTMRGTPVNTWTDRNGSTYGANGERFMVFDPEGDCVGAGCAGGGSNPYQYCAEDQPNCGERLPGQVQNLKDLLILRQNAGLKALGLRDISQYINPGLEGSGSGGLNPFRDPTNPTPWINPGSEGGSGISGLVCSCSHHSRCRFVESAIVQAVTSPRDYCQAIFPPPPECEEQRGPVVPGSPVGFEPNR